MTENENIKGIRVETNEGVVHVFTAEILKGDVVTKIQIQPSVVNSNICHRATVYVHDTGKIEVKMYPSMGDPRVVELVPDILDPKVVKDLPNNIKV